MKGRCEISKCDIDFKSEVIIASLHLSVWLIITYNLQIFSSCKYSTPDLLDSDHLLYEFY